MLVMSGMRGRAQGGTHRAGTRGRMMRMIFVHISRVVHGALCVRARASRRPCVPRRWRQCSGRAFARAKRAFVTTEARRDGGDDDVDGGCAMQCVSHSSFVIRHSFARVVNVVGVVVNVPNAVGVPRETTGRDDEDFLIFYARWVGERDSTLNRSNRVFSIQCDSHD